MFIIRDLIIILCIALTPLGSAYFLGGDDLMKDGKGLYVYRKRDLELFFKKTGNTDYLSKKKVYVKRNYYGTELWFIKQGIDRILFIGCDGDMEDLSLPGRINFRDEPQIWFSENREIHGDNTMLGFSLEKLGPGNPPFSLSGSDSRGIYFIKQNMTEKYLEIFSIEAPTIPLIRLKVLNSAFQILFTKDDRVFLFDQEEGRRPLTCWILKRNGLKLALDKKIETRWQDYLGRCKVFDISPWGDEVLILDLQDFPGRSRWYVSDLETLRLKKVGIADGYAAFLHCNILKETIKKQREKRRDSG